MPPPKISSPGFSPYGRYLIDVRERRIFHDMEGLKPECEMGNVPLSFVSRFNNPQWALQRGFTRCDHCHE